jgi:P-type Cu2+ transporter
MTVAATCAHCLLPVGRLGQRAEVNGETHEFCCYGCSLAYQVHHGQRAEPEAAWLLIRLGVGGFLAMNIMLFSLLLYSGTFGPADGNLVQGINVLLWLLATALLIILGGPFLRGAWDAAVQGRLGADMLVSVGVISAYGYSAFQVLHGTGVIYFDTVTMVLILFTLGRYLEAQARVRTARSLAPMLAAERAFATTVVDGNDLQQLVREILPEAIVRVRPGERVPVDGLVIEGRSQCDEAVLTGQPEPQMKLRGDAVCAGSVNGAGQLLIRATSAGNATRWVQISRLVREALSQKSLMGELVDRTAALFIPLVLLLAGATIWYWNGRLPFDQALLTGLAVLVVACPCALGLAAPLAAALGIGLAAQQGVLVRGGAVLERLAKIKGVAFDKTGTLTRNEAGVASVVIHDVSEAELLSRALGLAQGSEHPIARALTLAARTRGLTSPACSEVEARPGEGVLGTLAGVRTAMGSAAFMGALGWLIPPTLAERAEAGCTLVYVGWEGEVHGLVCLAYNAMPEAQAVVTALKQLGLGTCLLSGDTSAAVERIAKAVGIDTWRAALLPADKVEVLSIWARQHGPVAMVGDGLNDGPVLAAASIGVAVGGATDLARETADITLPNGRLMALPWLIRIARQVRGTMLRNLAWALSYNMVALTLAMMGMLRPVIAAALMAGSSLVVVINSLRANKGAGLCLPDFALDDVATENLHFTDGVLPKAGQRA